LASRSVSTSTPVLRIAAGALFLTLLAASVYQYRIERSPLSEAEAELSAEARRVARRGARDDVGRLLPVFWRGETGRSFAPGAIYLAALTGWGSDAPSAARGAAAAVGTLGVLLFYVINVRLFDSVGLAIVAGILLLMTPAYVTWSRTASHDGIWLVPAVLAWLLALAVAVTKTREHSDSAVAISVAALAGGVYTQPSGALAVVFLLAVTVAVLARAERLTLRAITAATAAAALVAVPVVMWLARYPAAYGDTFGQWLLHSAHIRDPIGWAQASTNWLTWTVIAKTYWDFFSPPTCW
jgi:hypothetical protein